MQGDGRRLCSSCPARTPFRADPEAMQRARDLLFEPPLDPGVRHAVEILAANNIETFESCDGGEGHAFSEPTIRFEGEVSEGLRALSVAIAYGLPVRQLRRTWGVRNGMVHGPWWEITLDPQQPDAP